MTWTREELRAQAQRKVDSLLTPYSDGWRLLVRLAEQQDCVRTLAHAHAYGDGHPIPYGNGEEPPGLAAEIERLLRARAAAVPAAMRCPCCKQRPCTCFGHARIG